MCYDVSFKTDIRSLVEYYPDLVHDDQISINFDLAIHIQGHAYKEHPIIFLNKEDGKHHLKLKEWGVIPFYVKQEKDFIRQRATYLNIRSERVFDPSSYWYKIRSKRCLMPVTAIYEHREVKGIKNKIPYWVALKDQPIFFLPALYSKVVLPDPETGEAIDRWTFGVLTRNANHVMMQIHNGGENSERMPLFMTKELSDEWLTEFSDERYKEILNFEMPSENLDFRSVYTLRGPKVAAAGRPDLKEKDEFFDWGDKIPMVEYH